MARDGGTPTSREASTSVATGTGISFVTSAWSQEAATTAATTAAPAARKE